MTSEGSAQRGRWPWPWVCLCLVLLGLLGAQTYLSYKFPIKQDLFGHAFRHHLGNRAIAYAHLLTSSHRFSRVGVAEIDEMIAQAAASHGVDPFLVKAIAVYESYYLSHAISTTGAMGLMALMPETARLLGVRDPFDPKENVDAGARFLAELSEAFDGDVVRVAAAYNAGPGNVRRYDGVPPFAETRAYVENVLHLRDFFERASRAAGDPEVTAR